MVVCCGVVIERNSMLEPREVFFDSGGEQCAADLYWPESVGGSLPVW